MHLRRGEVRGRPTTSSARSFAYHFFATQKNSTLHCASSPLKSYAFWGPRKKAVSPYLRREVNERGVRFIDDGKRELERPTTKSGAFGPPPYSLKRTGMISFATPQQINTIGARHPETCHLQFVTFSILRTKPSICPFLCRPGFRCNGICRIL